MSEIERWTIEGSAPWKRALVNVAGPMIPPHVRREVVLKSDYEALSRQLAGAIDLKAATDRVMALMIHAYGAGRSEETREQAERLARAALGER